MVAPLIPLKAAQGAGKALSGDIWSRTTFREVGKGKDKRLVESTVRVNAVTALAAAGAAGVLVIGGAATLFLVGVKLRPVTRAVTYGHWVWPDGTVASDVRLTTAAGIAPTRPSIYSEDVIDYVKPGYWDDSFWTGYICNTDGSTLDQTDPIAVAKWLLNHRYHDYEKVYERVYIEPVEVWKTVFIPESATWEITDTKEKTGFDIMERPTLAEGLTGAISDMASVPIDFATTSIKLVPTVVSASLQDLKEFFHLP